MVHDGMEKAACNPYEQVSNVYKKSDKESSLKLGAPYKADTDIQPNKKMRVRRDKRPSCDITRDCRIKSK
jgi:hypothetical protein